MSQQNRQSMAQTDYAEEGLPTADDYDPESLGTVSLTAGKAEQTWPQYGLELVPIELQSSATDTIDTGRRFIMRNGDYLADVSEGYKLLPNERAVATANDVARDLGAEPFHEYDGDWFVELDDHVYQDQDRRRVHALYAWQDGDVGGDDMSYGFAVHNSIDGSTGFSVALFSFRHACANCVFIGTRTQAEQAALNVENQREVVNSTSHSHTKGLDIDKEALKGTIKGTLTLVDDVHETYQRWVSERVTVEDAVSLLNTGQLATADLPGWLQDIEANLEEMDEDAGPDGAPADEKRQMIRADMPGESKWDAYNEITQSIWHRGSSNDSTRQRKMRALHRTFEPAEEAEVTLR